MTLHMTSCAHRREDRYGRRERCEVCDQPRPLLQAVLETAKARKLTLKQVSELMTPERKATPCP